MITHLENIIVHVGKTFMAALASFGTLKKIKRTQKAK
jgi:hypothetical protein